MRKPGTLFFKKVPFSVSFMRVCKQGVGETNISEKHSGHLKLTNAGVRKAGEKKGFKAMKFLIPVVSKSQEM